MLSTQMRLSARMRVRLCLVVPVLFCFFPPQLGVSDSTELAEVPAFAGRRSGLVLSPSTVLGIETCRCGRAGTCRRIIHERSVFMNNAG